MAVMKPLDGVKVIELGNFLSVPSCTKLLSDLGAEYHSAPVKIDAQAVFSQNAPMDHEMSDTAKKQYNLLLDVIDLCAIYY